ncbi:hypothetical protein GCM10008933_05280 [Paenibacillus motobuensis]|uniref:Uncharacterized protein n=1 Tax=Paenibacillus motobuensis TaxID=295324 RepID=A0ABN0XYF7_9BACL
MIDWAGIMKTIPYSDDDLVSVVLYVGFVNQAMSRNTIKASISQAVGKRGRYYYHRDIGELVKYDLECKRYLF